MELRKFLKSLRNGVAHQNIEPINEDGKWTGVRIWNLSHPEKVKDFEASFNYKQLKNLSLFLAQKYVELAPKSGEESHY
jgi:hypothetical protein